MEVEYNFSTFTIKKLKDMCTYLNIDNSGKKKVLIERLNHHSTTHYEKMNEFITLMEITNRMDDIHMDVEK